MGCSSSKNATGASKPAVRAVQVTTTEPPTPHRVLYQNRSGLRADPGIAEKYEEVRDVGKGAFGVCKLMRNVITRELVAVKLIERGPKIDLNVEREVLNHKSLVHPNVVQFIEVFVTETHLCVVLEYAAGGELFDMVAATGRLTENQARYFFQQLVLGLEYCHRRGVVHRDLKLENLLLDGSERQRLKIADFGYSKNMYASQPRSTVGTVAYIAPEVLTCKRDKTQYQGSSADLWSSAVILFVMLTGGYPFEDPREPRNMRKTVEAILDVRYTFPKGISRECKDLIRGLFQKDPAQRLSIPQIKQHFWFRQNLPSEMSDDGIARAEAAMRPSLQSDASITEILRIARTRLPSPEEVEFFAKHGYQMDQGSQYHTARAGESFNSDFVDREFDNYMRNDKGSHHDDYTV